MKKMYLLLAVLVCGALFLTACGSSNNLVCSGDMMENGQKVGTTEIEVEFDGDDKVKNASVTMAFEDEEYASQMYGMIELVIGFAKSSGQEVPDLDMKKDGKKIIIGNYAALTQLESDDEENSENIIGMTREEFKKYIEDSNDESQTVTCK